MEDDDKEEAVEHFGGLGQGGLAKVTNNGPAQKLKRQILFH
jgi:hypothetical protein